MPYKDKDRHRECCRKAGRTYYWRHREEIRAKRSSPEVRTKERKKAKEQVHRVKLEVFMHYSSGTPTCKRCGITDLDVLCLDHIDGGGTKDRLYSNHAGSNLHYFLRRNGYPDGFQVLCANCNLKKWVVEKK